MVAYKRLFLSIFSFSERLCGNSLVSVLILWWPHRLSSGREKKKK